jgi:hypothetical protein
VLPGWAAPAPARGKAHGALVLVEPETEWKDGGSVLARAAVEFKAALSTAAQGARDWLNPLPFVR